MTQNDEALLMDLYAGLAVVKSQQTEINRRLASIEEALDAADEKQDEKRDGRWTWLVQTVGQVLLVSAVVAIGKSLGMEISF